MADSVQWGEGRRADFLLYVAQEMQRALGNRGELEQTWRDYLEQYRAPFTDELKRFPYEGAPLSRDTQILTFTGWRRIDQIRVGEVVLTRRDDGALEWHPVQALPQRYADRLYHFKSRSMDLMVTEEHVMVAQAQRSGKTCRIPARDLWGKTGYFLPHHGEYRGGTKHERLWGCDAEAVAELVGWYIAEGSCTRNYAHGPATSLGIAQSQSANPEKCRRIGELLDRCGFAWRYDGHTFVVRKSTVPVPLFDALTGLGLCDQKHIPAFAWDWDESLLNALLRGLMQGDGHVRSDDDNNTMAAWYYTTSRRLADEVQQLAVLVGLHARLRQRVGARVGGTTPDGRQIQGARTAYEVRICHAPRAKYDRAYRAIVDYHDVAYCVTVQNHAIYARRNGIACWTGNSNFTMPVTAMNADPLIAQFMTTLHTPDNLWTLQPMNERWVSIAKPMQDYLTYLDQTRLHMFDVNYRAILEFIKLGTCIFEHGWTFERRTAMKMLPDGSLARMPDLVSGPFVDHVSLIDFLIPPEALHIQADRPFGASWVAKRFYLREAQLMARAQGQAPFLPNYDPQETELVRHFVNNLTVGNTVQDERFALDKYSPSYLRRIELWEVHARFDTTGTGTVDDVVAVLHLPSRRMLRAILNPYAHNQRPFEVARYFRGDGFYGIGECEQSNVFQRILSELTNANIDNVRVVNSPMLGVKAGANVVAGEPIYLLKMWMLDNPETDIKEVKFSTPYPSLAQLGGIFEQWLERRTGISDIQRGNPTDIPGRTPATTMLSLLQEGKRRFDLSLKDYREALNAVGARTLQNLQQFMSNPQRNPDASVQLHMVVQALGQPEGSYVAMQLALPLDDIASGLGVAVTATSGTVNKEVEKQNFLALVQLQTQLGQQYIQLASLFSNPQILQSAPQVAQVAQDVFKGFRELQTRLLEQFDVRNPEDLLPSAAVLMDGQAGLGAGLGAGAGPGAGAAMVGGGTGGANPAALLAGLLGAPSGLGTPG